MNLLNRFIANIQKDNLFQPTDILLIAASGGVDSVVLCELCFQAKFQFIMAHCNFKLRDKESERDKEFVVDLAKRYGVDIFVNDFETEKYAAENKLSIQEAARKLRYDWFKDLTTNPSTIPQDKPQTTNWILTAHHADDNIETMLMNFFRGTGIYGLRGMVPKKGNIVRPLLGFRKEELIRFAHEHGLSWVEDSSNESDKYSRNYIRHQLIPLIQRIYPAVEQNLLNNLQRFADVEILYKQSVERHKEKLLEKKGNEIHIPVLKLKKAVPLISIVHEIIREYGFTSQQVQEVIALLDSDTGKYVQSLTHRIIKNRNWLIISPKETEQAQNILIEEQDSCVHFEQGELMFHKLQTTNPSTIAQDKSPAAAEGLPQARQTTNFVARLNAAEITFPLLLRKWKAGDYFYPLGMRKKKKLSRFFIDQKISKSDKEKVWVLEMNKKIIWIVGMRIDDRFKIIETLPEILEITLKRQQTPE